MVQRYFRAPSRGLVDYHLERGWMPFHDAVGVNCKKWRNYKIKAQVPGIGHRAIGFVFDDNMSIIWLDMTTLLDGGRKSWHIIIINSVT